MRGSGCLLCLGVWETLDLIKNSDLGTGLPWGLLSGAGEGGDFQGR